MKYVVATVGAPFEAESDREAVQKVLADGEIVVDKATTELNGEPVTLLILAPKYFAIPLKDAQTVIGSVLGFANDAWQPAYDEPRIVVDGGRWIAPGTFGSDSGSIADAGDEYLVTLDAGDDYPEQKVYVAKGTFMLRWAS